MILEFTGPIWFWKGPAPWYFITVPPDESDALASVLRRVTYGWGMIPVTAHIGGTTWQTSMWPKDGGWILPLKATVRKAESLREGQATQVRLDVKI